MDFVAISIFTHVLAIFLLLAVMIFNVYNVMNLTDFRLLAGRLRAMTPVFHMINLIAAYTGMIVSAYSHDLSPTVILMVIATIFIMVLEIKRYKKMRVIRTKDIDKQIEFKEYAKKIYFIEIGVLIFTFVISKIF